MALVITQYIDAYNKCHSGGLSPDPSGSKNRIAFYLMPVIKPSRPGIWGQATFDGITADASVSIKGSQLGHFRMILK